MKAWAGAALLVACAASGAPAQEREHVTARVITRPIDVPATVAQPCTVADLAAALTQIAGIPSGIESLPGPCGAEPRAPAIERIPLLGLTVADALDQLVTIDRRYYWTETDGVVVMRPLKAWTDPRHFLHAAIAPLSLKDVNAGVVFEAVVAPIDDGRTTGHPATSFDGDRLITIETGPLSVIEALDALVRTHGRLRWEVKQCSPGPSKVPATVWLYRFNEVTIDKGIGRPLKVVRDPDGQPYDPCAGM